MSCGVHVHSPCLPVVCNLRGLYRRIHNAYSYIPTIVNISIYSSVQFVKLPCINGARGFVLSWGLNQDINGFFISPNPSSSTMALGLTQPLTEMSTRNLPGGKARPTYKTDILNAICEPIFYKMWDIRCLTSLSASTACYRNSFTFLLFFYLVLICSRTLYWRIWNAASGSNILYGTNLNKVYWPSSLNGVPKLWNIQFYLHFCHFLQWSTLRASEHQGNLQPQLRRTVIHLEQKTNLPD
jgi:hypothetical protein